MKKRWLSLLMVVAMLATLLPAGIIPASAAEDVKTIVCVGDSITMGSHSTDGLTYPYQLGQMLGSGYTIKNQGRSGNCMYGGGSQADHQYDITTLETDITSADTVIIMLGTNDTKYWTNETFHTSYVEQYQEVITTFKKWNSNLRFILATPPTSTVTNDTAEYSNTLLASITAAIQKMYTENYATDDSITMIDINAKTRGWNVDHANWYDDNVHFNNTGYEQLAKLFYEEFWDTTVHSFTVDGVEAENIKVDNLTGTISIAADKTALKDKSATVTVAKEEKASLSLPLSSLPTTFTVTAPRDGLTKTYTVNAVDDKSDFDKTLIYNAEQLKGLQGQALTGDYKLMADIKVEGNWTPITSLSGTFDGNGHTVTMNTTVSANNYGFIKTVNADSTVKDLTLGGSLDAASKDNVGGLAYENKGIIEGCTNAMSITNAKARTAGLVSNNYGLLNHCANTGNITNPSTAGDYVGGLVAEMQTGSVVANSYNTGDITNGGNGAGGIVANAGRSGYACTIVNCYNTGNITGNNGVTGAIAGDSSTSKLLTMTNVWNTGHVTCKSATPNNELVGRDSPTLTTNNILSTNDVASAVTTLNANLLVGATYNGKVYDLNVWTQTNGVPSFTGEQKVALYQDEEGFYHLRTKGHFDWFAANVNSQRGLNVILETDIDLTGKEWTPLSPYNQGFQGTFDGNGHTIKGLTIHNTAVDRTGMFLQLDGGTIKNLTLADVDITSTKYRVGALVGDMLSGTVSGVTVSGKVEVTCGYSACVGGVVGQTSGATKPAVIENCTNRASITLQHSPVSNTDKGDDVMVAGIVGQVMNAVEGSIVRGCTNEGAITGDQTYSKKVAGIAGQAYAPVVNCSNTGSITGKEDIAGIVGVSYNETAYVANVWNTGVITASSNHGGLVGRVNTGSFLYNGFTTGTVGAASTNANLQNVFYASTATASQNGTVKTEDELASADFVRTLNNFVIEHKGDLAALGMSKWAKGENGYPVLTGELATDEDVVDDSTLIETAAQLLALNGKTGNYTLSNDITVTAEDAANINALYLINNFNGTLNGDGYTVTAECNKALFGNMPTGSVVKNLTLDGSFDQADTGSMAALVLNCKGTIDNCRVAKTAVIKGKWRTGGLVSNLQDGGIVQNCTVSATISGSDQQYGGVVGYVSGNATATIKNCMFDGSVEYTGTGNHVGGILGYTEGTTTNLTIDSCTFSGTVTSASRYVGGIVGSVDATSSKVTISDCVVTGDITALQYIGGIVGQLKTGSIVNCRTTAEATFTATKTVTDNAGLGGIVGASNGTGLTIRGCVNEATLTAERDFSGGIMGFLGDAVSIVIDSCVNKGTLNTKNATGGIVGGGNQGTQLVIANCRNEGSVNGGNYTGGLMGLAQGNTLHLYVVNSSSVGSMTGTTGGIVQTIRGSVTAYLENCYSYNTQDMLPFNKGADTATIKADTCYAWRNSNGTHTSGFQMVSQATMQSADFVLTLDSYQPSEDVQAVLDANGITLKTWEYVSGSTPVLGTDEIGSKGGIPPEEDGTLLIGNELQLQYFASQVASNASLSARLTADIELTQNWTQIATAYTGTFDGDSHTISGFKQEDLTNGNVGFFKELAVGGVLKNLTLEGSIDCKGANSFGALVATNKGLVVGCVNKVNIVDAAMDRDENGYIVWGGGGSAATAKIGGLVGINQGTVDSCGNEAIVSAYLGDFVGGIAGQGMAGSRIINCYNTGEVAHAHPDFSTDNHGSCTGGIVGSAENSLIANCWNTGKVYENNRHRGYVGGITGEWGIVYNCYSTGATWYSQEKRMGCGIDGRNKTEIVHSYAASETCLNSTKGELMNLTVMQTADFVATLNAGVAEIPDEYKDLLKDVTLSHWAIQAGENDGYPVHAAKTFTLKVYIKSNVAFVEKEVSSAADIEAILHTVPKTLGGYTFGGWSESVDAQQIYETAEHNGSYSITAQYIATKTYAITLGEGITATYGDGSVVTSDAHELTFDTRITVSKADPNTTGNYWMLDGAIVGSASDSYTFYVSGENKIELVETSEVTDVTPVLQQAMVSHVDENYTLTVIAQLSIPGKEPVSEFGVVYTNSATTLKNLANDMSAVDQDTYVMVKSTQTAGRQYMTHLLNVGAGKTRYARAYAIVGGAYKWSNTVVQFKTIDDGTATKGALSNK